MCLATSHKQDELATETFSVSDSTFTLRRCDCWAQVTPANELARHVRTSGEMSDSTVRGVVNVIEETKTYGQKGFRKRLVVLEQDKGSFSNYIPVEFTRDNCDTVDELNMGDEIEVAYRLNGRKWQRDPQSEVKYFVSVEAMSFKVIGGSGGGEGVDAANDAFSEIDDEAPF